MGVTHFFHQTGLLYAPTNQTAILTSVLLFARTVTQLKLFHQLGPPAGLCWLW